MLLLLLLLLPPAHTGAELTLQQEPRGDATSHAQQRSFVIEDDAFVRDTRPISLLSGSLHYTRVHPHYWQDRLKRLRAMGLNTVCTYVPWMLHQQAAEESPSFDGGLDLVAFLREAQDQVRWLAQPLACCSMAAADNVVYWLDNTGTDGPAAAWPIHRCRV